MATTAPETAASVEGAERAEGAAAAGAGAGAGAAERRGVRGRRDMHPGAASQGAEPMGMLESVSTILGIGSEFEPYQYRRIEKPTSYLETMTHMVKGSIGAGVLAMPSAVRKLGLPAGVIGIAIIGAFATYCLHLLLHGMYEQCKRHRRGYMSYKTSMREALKVGPGTRWLAPVLPEVLEIALVVWQFGLCVVYAVSVADNMKLICDLQWPDSKLTVRQHLLLQFLPLLVVNHFKNLKLLAPVSTFANIVTLIGFILTFYYLVGDSAIEVTSEELKFKGFDQFPIFVGTTLFALEAVGVILTLEYNMAEPRRFLGNTGLMNLCMLGVVLLYCVVGGVGYARYHEDTKDSIVLNLPITEIVAKVAMFSFSLALFLSFPLQNYVAYQMIWIRLHPRLNDNRLKTADLVLKLFCVVLPWLVAFAIPKLGPVIGLFGALCLSLLGLVFPALLDLCLWWRRAEPDDWPTSRQEALSPRRRRWYLLRDSVIMILGLLALGAGVYTSILDITKGEN